MNKFKQQVYRDFSKILIDKSKFARTCSWNGKPLDIVEDARTDSNDYHAQGVNSDKIKIYCRDIDLQPKPRVADEVDLDGDSYYILNVQNPFAHYIIMLERRIT
jgi:hypothetical protein